MYHTATCPPSCRFIWIRPLQITTNPPFNVDKVKSETTQNAGRLPFGLPSVNKNKEVGNANYLWISYFYSYLNETGRAGFVMAASATDSKQGRDKDIREELVKTGCVDAMISVGNNFFYTKSLPCSLWFFDKAKNDNIKNKVLFIDARSYFTVVDKTLNEWSEWQMKNLNSIVWLYRGQIEKYKVLLEEYKIAVDEMISALPEAGKELAEMLEEGAAGHFNGNMPSVTADCDFEQYKERLEWQIEVTKRAVKQTFEMTKVRGKKYLEGKRDEFIACLDDVLTVIKEYYWLTEKFGDGVYADVLGLCKVASIDEVESKGWSLTPGSYVGVPPVEDDGVDFEKRMAEIHRELLSLQDESNVLMNTISQNMKEMGL